MKRDDESSSKQVYKKLNDGEISLSLKLKIECVRASTNSCNYFVEDYFKIGVQTFEIHSIDVIFYKHVSQNIFLSRAANIF